MPEGPPLFKLKFGLQKLRNRNYFENEINTKGVFGKTNFERVDARAAEK